MKKIFVSVLLPALLFIVGSAKSAPLYPFSDKTVRSDTNDLNLQEGTKFAGCVLDYGYN